MAVDALELRPRNAIALFDAAVRLCATTTGVWAITLPSGALLVGALFHLAEAIRRNQPLTVPVAIWTFAWMVRAVSQGAACHHVEQQILGATQPSVRASFKAALARAPGLITASAWLAGLNALLWTCTLGIGFFFVGAHAAGYAATMRGQGSVLGLYGTCARLLGPARFIAPWVRVAGVVQVLLALNIHLATQFALSLSRSLFGFDVTFAERFASMDNPSWLATIAAVTFALFEPVRAASATLLLIDGRVRQEGLDLIAQVEQLPQRKKPRGVPLAVALALCFALPARADTALHERAQRLSQDCGFEIDLSAFERVSNEDQSAMARFLSRVERRAEEEDCELAEDDLREGLRLFHELEVQPPSGDAQAQAKEILSRPEFAASAPPGEAEPKEEAPEGQGWWQKLLRALWEWLMKQDKEEPRRPPVTPTVDSPDMAGANVVMIGALVLVAGVLVFILIRSLRKPKQATAELDESGGLVTQPLEHDAMSALSKPAETWAGLADELAARGEYREAIRHLYLALLARLHRDGVIDYDPTLSNWEYLFAFKGASSLKAGFKELTRRFDFAWYGNVGVDSLAYSVFRQVAEPLLAPAKEGSAARA